MLNMIKPITLIMTCSACPSQWEGKLDDGRTFYCRYRWGSFYISVSDGPTDDYMEAVSNNYIMNVDYGEELDGCMSTEEMKELSKDHVDWSAV